VIRAISLATAASYKQVFEQLTERGLAQGLFANSNKVWQAHLVDLGWTETRLGRGAQPLQHTQFAGPAIAVLTGHVVAVLDNTIYDTWDCRHKTCWRTWQPGVHNGPQ